MPMPKPSRHHLGREALRRWYRPRRRAYPWRGSRDPYAIWISEVMLQQTQAGRVAAAYPAFLERFPTVAALAAAPRSAVVRAWDGLGHNRRAVALSEAARAIVHDHGGRVPRDPVRLRDLPGVGPYTAAAIASLAFGAPVAAIDTNFRRVVARVHLGAAAVGATSAEIATLAAGWLDPRDPGAWNQALMDLGREVCRRRPRCEICPLARDCRFRAAGAPVQPSARRQAPFEGSDRQVRGAVVRALRGHRALTLGGLSRRTGFGVERVTAAVRALAAEGLLVAGPAAIAGRGRGRVRLA
jgi:A/G-specific adenine glycosylase